MRKKRKRKPIIGVTCEVAKLKPYYSEFELACDYRYIRAVIRAGGLPMILPINHGHADLKQLVSSIDGLLIIGGADIHPSFYGEKVRQQIKPMYRGRTLFDINLYREAKRQQRPVLAVCYGMQLLNVIYGGTLYQDIRTEIRAAKNHESKRSPSHLVQLEPGCQLDFHLEGNVIHAEVKRLSAPTQAKDGFGMLVCKKPGKRSLADFDVALAMREAADDRA